MAEHVRKWAISTGFGLFAEKGYESDTLTTITNKRGISVEDLNKKLGEKGVAISNGYGDLKEKTFRIAHMGDTKPKEIKALLGMIDDIIGADK